MPLLYTSTGSNLLSIFNRAHSDSDKGTNVQRDMSSIIFLGTGSSVGSPGPYLLMQSHPLAMNAAKGNPIDNKNYRCNPSLLIQYCDKSSQTREKKNIIIDVGKTFRETIIRWFPKYGIKSVDAVVLTHGHADAIFGLDDIRSVQPPMPQQPMDVYLSTECLGTVRRVFAYLFPDEKPKAATDDKVAVVRHVSSVAWNVIEYFKPFETCGLAILPIPVIHGEDMVSLGFIFGARDRVCYISDISRMPDETMHMLQGQEPFSLLVVDSLFRDRSHPTHFSMDEAVELVRRLRPKRALLVGMSGHFGDHEEANTHLRKLLDAEGLDIQLAHDGLRIELDL